MNKRTITISGLVVVLILAISGLIYYLFQPGKDTPTSTNTTIKNGTWERTYTNPEFGITFSYPRQMLAKEDTNRTSDPNKKFGIILEQAGPNGIEQPVYIEVYSKNPGTFNSKTATTKSITVAGQPATYIKLSGEDSDAAEIVTFQHKGNYLAFWNTGTKVKIFTDILASLKLN